MSTRITHVEPHIKESNNIRDLIFGFGDGVNTSLGIVAGVGGAIIAADTVILAALIGMFTGTKAMAVQSMMSGSTMLTEGPTPFNFQTTL